MARNADQTDWGGTAAEFKAAYLELGWQERIPFVRRHYAWMIKNRLRGSVQDVVKAWQHWCATQMAKGPGDRDVEWKAWKGLMEEVRRRDQT
jgi:hypothetical protein